MPRPEYDPAYPRTLIPQILELKYAMDDFNERELPYLDTNNAAVTLPVSQFKGNYQTVKAELLYLGLNTYSPPQLKVQDVEEMGQNLRFLQKEARKVEPAVEGFSVRGVADTIQPGTFVRVGASASASPSASPSSGTVWYVISSSTGVPQYATMVAGGGNSVGITDLGGNPLRTLTVNGQTVNLDTLPAFMYTALANPGTLSVTQFPSISPLTDGLTRSRAYNSIAEMIASFRGSASPSASPASGSVFYLITSSTGVPQYSVRLAQPGNAVTVLDVSGIPVSKLSLGGLDLQLSAFSPDMFSALANPGTINISPVSGVTVGFVRRGPYNSLAEMQASTRSPSSSSSASASATPSSSPSSNTNPISFTELQTLSLKLTVEITRLTATGTTDPVIQARINVYTQMKGTVDSLIAKINNKTLDPTKIPIAKSDYDTFLPSLGSSSAGPAGVLFNSGQSSLSSLFNAYNAGDVDGASLAETLFNTYADTLVNGMSYNVSLSYTSPNETTKEVAKALYRGEFQNTIESKTSDGFTDTVAGLGFSSQRGDPSSYDSPDSAKVTTAGFNWKNKCKQLYDALKRMSLDPGDFGCLAPGAQVSPDYSWRGNAKMICTRAATHADPGLPEQIGCPPVNWPGWRS